MKILGLTVLFIAIIFAVGFTDSGVVLADEGDLYSLVMTSGIEDNLTIQDMLNVEFESISQMDAEFVPSHITDYDRGAIVETNYMCTDNILRSGDLRVSEFL